MAYEIDREEFRNEPKLEKMSLKALELLSQNNEKGFFLMVEGSKIDTAAHSNDPATAYREAIQLTNVFEMAINFAQKDKNTLVLVTADHETGGISLGIQPYGVDTSLAYELFPNVLRNVKRSSQFIGSVLQNTNFSSQNISEVFFNYTGVLLSQTELEYLMDAKMGKFDLWFAVSELISMRARIGWTSIMHTGSDVNIYGYGPSVENFCGNIDNTDIGNRISKIFNWDIAAVTKELKDFNTTG